MTSFEPGLRMAPLAELHESDENPREITEERFEALKYSLGTDPEMMAARPVIATLEGEVVCGNMRLRAQKEMGRTEGYIFFADLTAAQKREWMLRDNQEYGDWVPDELARLIAAHKDGGGDMRLLGFGDAQLENLIKLAREDESAPSANDENPIPPESWAIVVECESEAQQAALLDELAERDISARALFG